jgi:hypothetical protein
MKQIMKPTRISPLASAAIVGAVVALGVLAAGLSMVLLDTPSQARSLNTSAPFPEKNKPDNKTQARFVADKGKFRIMVSGQQVGKEEFEIGPSGSDWTRTAMRRFNHPKEILTSTER